MIMISKNVIGIYEGGGGRIAAGGGLFAGGLFAAGLIAGGLFASGLNAAPHWYSVVHCRSQDWIVVGVFLHFCCT